MMKRKLSVLLAAMSVAMFCVLYPEYILLPDTYEYIAEEELRISGECAVPRTPGTAELTDLLYAKPDRIRVSSKILQILKEEGKKLWKNKD